MKSTQRVRDLGEVFTPANIVDEMLNLLPEEMWQVHPSKTFLEPAVGTGNFVSAILSRKLTAIDGVMAKGLLPAGVTPQAAEFHALEALSSIYGIDISEDNIIGGTEGHEIACRPRLLKVMKRWHEKYLGETSSTSADFLEAAQWIAEHNMIIGNMLEFDADGQRVDRQLIQLIDYDWQPGSLSVDLVITNMSDVIEVEQEQSSGFATLFGPEAPKHHWSGPYGQIAEASSVAVTTLSGELASNGRQRK